MRTVAGLRSGDEVQIIFYDFYGENVIVSRDKIKRKQVMKMSFENFHLDLPTTNANSQLHGIKGLRVESDVLMFALPMECDEKYILDALNDKITLYKAYNENILNMQQAKLSRVKLADKARSTINYVPSDKSKELVL